MIQPSFAKFPSHLEKNKDKEWIKKFIRACYDDFNSINTESFYAGRSRYAEISKYMIGTQDPSPFIKKLSDRIANIDKSEIKLPKDILSIASKYARMMVSTLSKNEREIRLQAIDPTSVEETNEYYADAKARLLLQKSFREAGLNPDEFFEGTDKSFQSEEDLDLYMEYTYKHRLAIEAEQALMVILNNSDFDSIRDEIIKQLVWFGFAGYKDYFDTNGDTKVRIVNADSVIVSRCMYSDFRDAIYVGEILDYSIAEVKEMDVDNEIQEEAWQELAKRSVNGNGMYNQISRINPDNYESHRVQVFDVEFFSSNEIILEKGVNKYGNKTISTKSELKRKYKDNEYETKAYKVVYEGKWIVGTDIFFGCKLQTNMKRPMNNISDVKLSYHLFAPMLNNMETKSIGEDMIPVQNMIQLLWTKYKEAILGARKKGIAIEIGALENLPLGSGGKAFEPMDGISFFNDTGSLIYRRLSEDGKDINYKPIEMLENGIGDEAMRWFREIQSQISIMQTITGYNELTDGSTPEARTLNGVAKQAAESTNNSIDFMKKGEKRVFESLLFSLMIRIQDSAKSGRLEGYINALGRSSIEFFKLSPEISSRELGIQVVDAPDVFQREALKEKVELSIQAKEITIADSLIIENVPNTKHAEAILRIRIQKNLEEQQKINLQNIEAQSKVQQDSAAMASQLKTQEINLETQSKIAILNAEKNKELELLDKKYAYELELKRMEVGGRVEQNTLQSNAKMYAADRQAKTKEAEFMHNSQNQNLQKAAQIEHEKELAEAEIENEKENSPENKANED